MLTALGLCAAVALSACTGGGRLDDGGDAPRLTGALTSFDSCDQALRELKDRAKAHVDISGFGGYATEDGQSAGGADKSAEAPAAEGDDYSGTNVYQAGVDEPDVVKTDGERIVSIAGGRLYVVDAAAEELRGSVAVEALDGGGWGARLLLHGDRALVIAPHNTERIPGAWREDGGNPAATSLTLVDLSAAKPKVVNDYLFEGTFVDARAVASMSRIVVSSQPRLPHREPGLFQDEIDARKSAIEDSVIEDWLPRYRVAGEPGQVPCRALARPAQYSASSMLTILSFDLDEELDDGNPLSLEADGQTVYGTGEAVYVANNRTEFAELDGGRKASTELYRFGIGDGRAVDFQSAGEVPGYLLNQYSMSEHDGYLRVATTQAPRWNAEGEQTGDSSSAVHTLKIGGHSLRPVGEVGGLGEGEQIKSVRFLGDVAYVVTFRQTDPLYTVELSDPKRPEVTGELKIPGYSAYLHPASDDRLIGVGRSADDDGTVTGMQVSLFDVGDPAAPKRRDTHDVAGASTEVEFDPHAFLYWPKRKLLVVPVTKYDSSGTSMLVLKVGDDELDEVGSVRQKETDRYTPTGRALVIGSTLWTMSEAGLLASDIDGLDERAWLAFE